jgi:hypothetical protein
MVVPGNGSTNDASDPGNDDLVDEKRTGPQPTIAPIELEASV